MVERGYSVLIVDDSEMNRDTLARRLRQQGCKITMAADGKEALKILSKQLFDLILLDIMMPEVDGYTVLGKVKASETLQHMPVIMISALEELDSVMRCMEMGAEDYLTKPFDPVLLKAAIARSLSKNPPRATTAPEIPAAPLAKPQQMGGQKTTLQSSSTTPRTRQPTNPSLRPSSKPATEAMSIEEVVSRLIRSGKMSRKGYSHLSRAIFNATFAKRTLTEQEYNQLNLVFSYIHTGKIKIID
ncbi:response regulator receiver protein [Thalassoporum mexicanum PCC 7367]|uniref:response regulator n=1 Tax=Thalassoporum mexicanum TaxID=3457544 RepID=UPI00029F89E2|nr:response regulator [Pseudanabaena sp. PCC 7367]AFY69860.1 response regulator receiver protein [Pseudanabaena sp. PCC 7367]